MSLGSALRSIIHWLIPWGSVSMRNQPIFISAFFFFHICLLGVPLFLNAHNLLWDEAFGVSLWSMPDSWADTLTIVFLVCAAFLLVRRLVRPEVRISDRLGLHCDYSDHHSFRDGFWPTTSGVL